MPLLEEIARVGSFPPHKDTVRRYIPGKEFSPEPQQAGTVSDFQPPALWKKNKNSVVYIKSMGILQWQPKLRNWPYLFFILLGPFSYKERRLTQARTHYKDTCGIVKVRGSYGSSQSWGITSLVSPLRTGRQLWNQVSNEGSENHKNKEWSSFLP